MSTKRFLSCLFIYLITLSSQADDNSISLSSVSSEKQIADIVIDKSGRSEEIVITYLKANDDRGRVQLSAIPIAFDHHAENVEVLGAGLIQDGKEELVPLTQIKKIASGSGTNGIRETTTLMIPFSGVKTGATVWYKTKKTIKKETFVSNYSGQFVYGFTITEKESRVNYKSEIPLFFALNDSNKVLLLKTISNQPPYLYEIYLTKPVMSISENDLSKKKYRDLKKSIIRVDVTSSSDWLKLSQMHASLYNTNASELENPVFKKIAATFVKKTETADTVEDILVWMAENMTYSGRWFRPSAGVRPRSLDEIMVSRVGDCKDFAKLFLAFTKVLSIQAQPLYVKAGAPGGPAGLVTDPIDEKNPLPAMNYFNHVVVRYHNGKNWLTIDPGRSVADSRRTPYFLGNVWAVNLPTALSAYRHQLSQADYGKITVDNNFTARLDGSLIGETKLSAEGEMSNFLKDIYFREGKEKFELAAKSLLPVKQANSFKMEILSPVKRTYAPLNLKFNYNSAQNKEKNETFSSIYPPIYSFNFFKDYQSPPLTVPGEIKQKTRILGQFVKDEFKLDCYVLGPTVVAKRKVENTKNGIEITDYVNQKHLKTIAQDTETQAEIYAEHASMVGNCMTNVDFKLQSIDPTQKSFEAQIDLSKPLGPESQTDHSGTESKRRLREIDYRISKNSKDANLWYERSDALLGFGYLYGDNRVLDYVDEAILNAEHAAKIDPSDPGFVTRAAVLTFHYKNGTAKASEYFQRASLIDKNRLEVLNLAGIIQSKEKNYDAAEKYFLKALQSPDPLKRKKFVIRNISELYDDKKDYKKSLPYYEQLISLEPNDAWLYHNAAIAYRKDDQEEKAIQLERKALSIMEFGAAKSTLKKALVWASWDVIRQPTKLTAGDIKKVESYLSEAYRYDPKYGPCLYKFALYYIKRAEDENNLAYLKQSRNYLDELKEADSEYYAKHAVEEAYLRMEKELKSKISTDRATASENKQ